MPKLTISHVPAIDGEYDFSLTDGEEFTVREGMRIAGICGLTVPALVMGVLSEHDGARAALSTVVLERHGKVFDLDALLDAPRSSIVFDWSDVLAEETDHPVQPPVAENEPDSTGGANDAPAASGLDS